MNIEDVRIGDIIVYNKEWMTILGVVYSTRKLVYLVDDTGFVDVFVNVLDSNGELKYDSVSARIGADVSVIRK